MAYSGGYIPVINDDFDPTTDVVELGAAIRNTILAFENPGLDRVTRGVYKDDLRQMRTAMRTQFPAQNRALNAELKAYRTERMNIVRPITANNRRIRARIVRPRTEVWGRIQAFPGGADMGRILQRHRVPRRLGAPPAPPPPPPRPRPPRSTRLSTSWID